MKRIVFALAFALAVSACAGQAPVTKIGNDVQSLCLESRSEYSGYRDFCDVTRTCKPAEQSKAKALHTDAQKICTANPPDTTANRSAVKGILARQRTVGYAQ